MRSVCNVSASIRHCTVHTDSMRTPQNFKMKENWKKKKLSCSSLRNAWNIDGHFRFNFKLPEMSAALRLTSFVECQMTRWWSSGSIP